MVSLGRAALAQGLETVGRPIDGKMGFQPAATEIARDLQDLDHMVLLIISAITVLVTALLIWVIIRYNSRANPTPATFTHNSPLEVAWTVVPIVILVFIGAFSLPVLFKQQEIPQGDITIKVTGYQWYWGYEYVGEDVAFDSFLVDGATRVDALGADQPIGRAEVLDDVAVMKLEALGYSRDDFLLATDTAVVLPIGKSVVMQVTGADVIHSWAMPAFGVKQDGVPGRLAQLWFTPEREGVYFGQCSELCGKSHAYMPITVKVVSQAAYDVWLAGAKAGNVQLSADVGTPVTLAAAD
ncbi:cytochrome c oxidase subunit II [Paracoccaceae bacterium Fryx2]|nr:cytochrome c oxidase subunit II [Paracoccaceae bacterium Fryx2]